MSPPSVAFKQSEPSWGAGSRAASFRAMHVTDLGASEFNRGRCGDTGTEFSTKKNHYEKHSIRTVSI